MKNMIKRVNGFILKKVIAVRTAVGNKSGEGYIDTAVKILIAVVLGALLLAGLYLLFGEVVMPTLNQRIRDMFNYAG
jgi:Na+-driven multidrug efflux pump